mmetsp:Transcript_51885/g.62375  ORF Transcript_51885/g.62375 Transcript_51885/m.62375 type:complete len:314 (-) Transcript_51885:116-1057(-)|eukprot:CAMPEP_0172500402 /NCGR_PEP_ID=MMETSP1066-20121228/137768_1 /TAXON_ID=671091 /ORGANISM="Coscinodiscus wailesii, Strain CCMP2513" /LENGTH=313 /DNA_ID=CAMNT_0013274609 /DNA_START=82 /DNA_END=1023 /DNA_ORIENTATION=-
MRAIKPFYYTFALFLFYSRTNAKPFVGKIHNLHSPTYKQNSNNNRAKYIPPTAVKIASIRGGDTTRVVSKSETLAKTFSALTSLDGLGGAFLPQTTCSWVGMDFENDGMTHIYCEILGAHALALTVMLYLVTSHTTSVEQAIAYGCLVRLAVFAKLVVTGRTRRLGVDMGMAYTLLTATAAVTYNIFAEVWEPSLCAKTMGIVFVLMGTMMQLNPISTQKMIFNWDVDKDKDIHAKGIIRLAAAYLLLGGLHTILITSGVDAVKAVGYTSLAFAPFMLAILEMGVKDIFGLSKEIITVLAFILLASIGVGILM